MTRYWSDKKVTETEDVDPLGTGETLISSISGAICLIYSMHLDLILNEKLTFINA